MPETSIASLIGAFASVVCHRPWPRYEVDAECWSAVGAALGRGRGELLGLWADRQSVHLALRSADLTTPAVVSVKVQDRRFASVGRLHPPALRLERAVHDLYGIVPDGHPDLRPWLDHGAWDVAAPLGASRPAARRGPADYPFLAVKGEGLHQIPVGPVHAGIIEPGHFRFTANGETVARLEERFGYAHKGIEGLTQDVDLARAQRVVARVSGDATVALSYALALAVEAALGIEAPPRAAALRGIMAELERIANHLGDIGAICNDAAFALIHAHCGILRERVLAACDHAFGHRLMMDRVVPGGVVADLSAKGADRLLAMLDELTGRFEDVVRVYDLTPSLQDRTCGTGKVSGALAARWAAGGYIGRACGRSFDARRDLPYAPYAGVRFEVPVLTAGDVDARVWVRIREIQASVRLLRGFLAALPEGPLAAALPPREGESEGVAVTEAFRGDLLVWIRLAPGRRVARCHVRDPSWFQWPLLEAAIEANIVADFPLCNKSFNCSYSGHDL
jgi:Ni,Fe-hydrogenase III large subunit